MRCATWEYQRINGEDMITSPKTEKSNRVIDMPKFLCDEMEDYFEAFIFKIRQYFGFNNVFLRHKRIEFYPRLDILQINFHSHQG